MPPRLGLNQDDLKRRNRNQVLNTILESAAICRRDIAARTGLTAAAVGNIVGELLDRGLVEEIGVDRDDAERRGGPNPILLSITSERPYLLTLHLGPSALDVGIVNLRGQTVARASRPLSPDCSVAAFLGGARELSAGLCRERDLALGEDFLAVGFATAGNFAEDGTIVWHRHPPFVGLAARERLRELFGLPVFVGNTARAMALAEGWFGAGRGLPNYLFMLVGEVVDSALVADRAVVVGKRYFSTLLAHAPVAAGGPLCYCGRRGCLEAMAADAALLRQAEEIARDPSSVLASLASGRPPSKSLVVRAAERGDERCRELLARRGGYIGVAIAEALNWLDVQAVIVAKDLGAPASQIEARALELAYLDNLGFRQRAPEVIFAEKQSELALLGPATLALRWVFSPHFDLYTLPNRSQNLARAEALVRESGLVEA